MIKRLNFKVEKEFSGQRIDQYLQTKLTLQFSRTYLKKAIQEENILLNGKIVKPHQKIKENDQIIVNVQEQNTALNIQPVKMPLDIIYEDDDVLLVNKPAGLVVHPACGHLNDTLVNGLVYYTQQLSDFNGPLKPGIVHRLDKDTSGVLVIAKNNQAHRNLAQQFQQHTIKKVYIAVVRGKIEYDEGSIDAPISRSPFNRKKMTVLHSSSRHAKTHYRILKRTSYFTVLEVYPQTGRTHQIRVHLAHIGHPLLGDSCYGKVEEKSYIKRQALHAKVLGFFHPRSKKYMEFEASLPEDILNIISKNDL